MREVVQPLVLADSMNTWPKLGNGLVLKKSRYSSMNLMAGGISLWAFMAWMENRLDVQPQTLRHLP